MSEDTNERDKLEREIDERLGQAAQTLEKAKSAVGRSDRRSSNGAVEASAEAQTAIQELGEQQKFVAAQVSLLFEMGKDLGKRNLELQRATIKLEQEKADLQTRERLFSMGFFASVFAILVGLLVKAPTIFLDRDFRKLEIEEKRLHLLEKSLSVKEHQAKAASVDEEDCKV